MPKILNIAHRGFTRSFPDNTLESFNAAIKLGADGIECDVHETADNRFIIYHDDDIEGKSIAGLTLAETQQVRLAEKYHIPTLEQTLEACHGRVLLNIELKLVYSLDRFLSAVRAVMQPEEVLFSSFYGTLINELADLAPEIRRGILTGFPVADPLKLVSMVRAQVLLPRFGFATMALVDKMHSHKLALMVWDCNTQENIRAALAWHVDAIITDNPDIVMQEMPKEK
jgi:glycerophosphoryl diester phosphodiesterase